MPKIRRGESHTEYCSFVCVGSADSPFLCPCFCTSKLRIQIQDAAEFIKAAQAVGDLWPKTEPKVSPLHLSGSYHLGGASHKVNKQNLDPSFGQTFVTWQRSHLPPRKAERLHSEMNHVQSSYAKVMIGLKERRSGLTTQLTHVIVHDLGMD